MSKPANPKTVGAFVLGAFALIAGGIVVLGGGKFFQQTAPVVMYFQGAVSGLSVGSPVNFRGVKVGQVTNLFIRYSGDTPSDVEIPVFAELSAKNLQIVGASGETEEVGGAPGTRLKQLVDHGLRAQLALPSLVTGQAQISLDFSPGTPIHENESYPDRVQIPTVPSTLQEVQATLEQVYVKISQLPLDELVDDARNAIKGANRLVNDPALYQSIAQAGQAMAELQRVAGTLDAKIGPLIASIEETSATANATLKSAQTAISATDDRSKATFQETDAMLRSAQAALVQADSTLKTVNGVIQPGGTLNYEIVNALRETAAAARSLRDLMDQLQRNPNALLFGRPGAGANK